MSSLWRYLLLFLPVLVGCSVTSEEPRSPPPRTLDELKQAITEMLDKPNSPGVSLALTSPAGLLATMTFGLADRTTGRAVTPETVFRAGSISKSFVALAVLKLVEEGKLTLNARLRDLIGEALFANPWEDTDPVRLAHVLRHTAGFDDLALCEFAADDPNATLIDALTFHPKSRTSRWPPGRFFSYSNGGPVLAAYAVERLTGQTFERYLDAQFLEPLGMTSSGFLLTDRLKPNLARSYHSEDVSEIPYKHILNRPSGALLSTPTDLTRLIQMLLNRGSYQGKRLLRPESIDQMEDPSAGDRPIQGYGLGNDLLPYKGFRFQGHLGAIDGFLAVYGYAPELDVGYVLMLNVDNSKIMHDLHDLIRAYLTREANKPDPPCASVSAEKLQAWTGYYEPFTPRMEQMRFLIRLVGLRYVSCEGETLRLHSLLGPSQQLVPTDEAGSFRREEDPSATLAFLQDGANTLLVSDLQIGNLRRVPGWWVGGQILVAVVCISLMLSAVLFALIWIPRKLLGRMKGARHLGVRVLPFAAVLTLFSAFGLLFVAVSHDPIERLGNPTIWSVGFCVLTWLFALLTSAGLYHVVRVPAKEISRGVRWHALLVSLANLTVLFYLAYWGILGVRTWT